MVKEETQIDQIVVDKIKGMIFKASGLAFIAGFLSAFGAIGLMGILGI